MVHKFESTAASCKLFDSKGTLVSGNRQIGGGLYNLARLLRPPPLWVLP